MEHFSKTDKYPSIPHRLTYRFIPQILNAAIDGGRVPRPGCYIPGHAKVKDRRRICGLIHRVRVQLIQCILKLCHIVVVQMMVAQIVVTTQAMPVAIAIPVAIVVVAWHQRGYVDIIYSCNGGQQVVVYDVDGSCKE